MPCAGRSRFATACTTSCWLGLLTIRLLQARAFIRLGLMALAHYRAIVERLFKLRDVIKLFHLERLQQLMPTSWQVFGEFNVCERHLHHATDGESMTDKQRTHGSAFIGTRQRDLVPNVVGLAVALAAAGAEFNLGELDGLFIKAQGGWQYRRRSNAAAHIDAHHIHGWNLFFMTC